MGKLKPRVHKCVLKEAFSHVKGKQAWLQWIQSPIQVHFPSPKGCKLKPASQDYKLDLEYQMLSTGHIVRNN